MQELVAALAAHGEALAAELRALDDMPTGEAHPRVSGGFGVVEGGIGARRLPAHSPALQFVCVATSGGGGFGYAACDVFPISDAQQR